MTLQDGTNHIFNDIAKLLDDKHYDTYTISNSDDEQENIYIKLLGTTDGKTYNYIISYKQYYDSHKVLIPDNITDKEEKRLYLLHNIGVHLCDLLWEME